MPYSAMQQLSDWLDEVLAAKSDRTREQYKYVLRKLYTSIGDVDLLELRPKHIRQFMADMKAAGMSQRSLVTLDWGLRAIFNRLEEKGKLDFGLPKTWHSPLTTLDRLPDIEVPKQPLSKPELTKLIDTLPRRGFINSRNHAAISFFVMTGARLSELRFANVSKLDLEKGMIDLQVTKGNKPRFVYLPRPLVRILATYLRKHPKNCDYLFPTSTGKPVTRSHFTRFVRRACEHAGIPVVGPHRLRHSYITHMLNDGAPLKFVQSNVGHKNVKTTMRYHHITDDVGVQLANQFNPLGK